MKGALARNLTRVGPAVERLAERAKTMVTLLAKRRERAPRRCAARRRRLRAAALHATRSPRRPRRGRRPRRSRPRDDHGGTTDTKRKATIAAAVMLAAIVGAIAIEESHHDARPKPTAPAALRATAADVAAPRRRARARRARADRCAAPRRGAAADVRWRADDSDTDGPRAQEAPSRRAVRQRPRAPRQRAAPQDGLGRSSRSRARSSRPASP